MARDLRIEETQIYETRKHLIEAALHRSEQGLKVTIPTVQAECGVSAGFIRNNRAYSDIGRWINSLDSEPLKTPRPEGFAFDPQRNYMSQSATLRRVEDACKKLTDAGTFLSYERVSKASGLSMGSIQNNGGVRDIIIRYRTEAAKPDENFSGVVYQRNGEQVVKLPAPVKAVSYRTGEVENCTHQWQRWSKRLKRYRQCGYLTEPQFRDFLKSRQRQKGVAA